MKTKLDPFGAKKNLLLQWFRLSLLRWYKFKSNIDISSKTYRVWALCMYAVCILIHCWRTKRFPEHSVQRFFGYPTLALRNTDYAQHHLPYEKVSLTHLHEEYRSVFPFSEIVVIVLKCNFQKLNDIFVCTMYMCTKQMRTSCQCASVSIGKCVERASYTTNWFSVSNT